MTGEERALRLASAVLYGGFAFMLALALLWETFDWRPGVLGRTLAVVVIAALLFGLLGSIAYLGLKKSGTL